MVKPLDWDDLRVFLAVARTGRFTAASQRVGLDLSTTARRIDRLEDALGMKVFDRSPAGVTLTPHGVSIFARAERVEAKIIEAAEDLSDNTPDPVGAVRLAMPEELGASFILNRVQHIRRAYPGIRLELLSAAHATNLLNREVNILISLERIEEPDFHSSKLCDLDLGLYASHEYIARRGMPRSIGDLKHHRFVLSLDDISNSDELEQINEIVPADRVVLRSNSKTAQKHAVAAGCGVGLLHHFSTTDDARLVAILPGIFVRRTYWIMYHESQQKARRIRAVISFLKKMAPKDGATPLRPTAPHLKAVAFQF